MTVTVANIIPPKQAENVQTTQYTSTGLKTIVDKFTATNTSGASATLSVNLVTVGDTSGNQNLIVKTVSIAPSETYAFPELIGQVLESGGFISTIASAATSITISASGRQIS